MTRKIILSWLCVGIGATVASGHALGVPILTTWLPGVVDSKPATAAMLVMVGVLGILAASPVSLKCSREWWINIVSGILLGTLVGSASLYFTGEHGGGVMTVAPGAPSVGALLMLGCIGVAGWIRSILLMPYAAMVLARMASVGGCVVLAGYLLGYMGLPDPVWHLMIHYVDGVSTAMSPPTAAAIIAAGWAVNGVQRVAA